MTTTSRERLHILVAESHAGAATPIVRELRRRGHEVLSCTPPPGSTAPCVGLATEGSCPLDEPVDVVVDVHAEAGRRLRKGELPSICAMRLDVPVVVVGSPDTSATITWATRRCDLQEAPDVCEMVGAHNRAKGS